MTFFSLLGFLIMSNIITAISSFYLSKDIPLLLSKPVEIRDILRLKTFEAFMNSSWMVLSFIPPVFIAYGISYGAPAGYYLLILGCFLLFSLITAGIGITTAHMLTRLFLQKDKECSFWDRCGSFPLAVFFDKKVIPQDISTPEGFINSIMSFKTESPMLPSYWITEAVFPILKKAALVFLSDNSSEQCFVFLFLSEIAGLRFFTW